MSLKGLTEKPGLESPGPSLVLDGQLEGGRLVESGSPFLLVGFDGEGHVHRFLDSNCENYKFVFLSNVVNGVVSSNLNGFA